MTATDQAVPGKKILEAAAREDRVSMEEVQELLETRRKAGLAASGTKVAEGAVPPGQMVALAAGSRTARTLGLMLAERRTYKRRRAPSSPQG